MPLVLALVAFVVYWPSLKSDFVYDAHKELFEEGFATSLSNLPDVLSLKVLGMSLMLGSRPGALLYLMLVAAVCGKEPFGFHLCNNLLHAANVALLFVLLRCLVTTEFPGLARNNALKTLLATAVVTLIFALHPLAVEPVSAINYSSDLLVTFFTLLALMAAIAFRPDNLRVAMITGTLGTICAFAATTCKESGVAVALLLVIYWFLFRRGETKLPWLLFLGSALAVTAAFLAARFLLAPPSIQPLGYLGGSLSQVFLLQPCLWVFMLGKLVWPTQLSADYTIENASGLSTSFALAIFVIVLMLQAWLAWRNRIGALGVAIYWIGLVTVSNFIPLHRILGDRFYYLPLTGVAMQLLALLLMMPKLRWDFWVPLALLSGALVPLVLLTLVRETVFADDYSLWSNTLLVSPLSSQAYEGLGIFFFQKGDVDKAISLYKRALAINPGYIDACYNLGVALFQKKQVNQAMVQYEKALAMDPNISQAHCNLGLVLFQTEQVDEAILHYQKALAINPDYAEAHNDLGLALFQKGQANEAILHYQKALQINPNYAEAHNNLGNSLSQKGQGDEAILHYQKALEINPDYAEAHYNLGIAFLQKGQLDEALLQFQGALKINPNYAEAHNNLGVALFQKGLVNEAILQLQEAIHLQPDYHDAQVNLAQVKTILQQKPSAK